MSTNEYEIAETLIINLGVIGQITNERKISTRGKYLNLYDISIYQSLTRWWYSESRDTVLAAIKIIMLSSFELINKALKDISDNKNNISDKYLNMTPKNFLKTIRNNLSKANIGLGYLKNTYTTDVLFVEKLKIQTEFIDKQIESIENVIGKENEEIIENEKSIEN